MVIVEREIEYQYHLEESDDDFLPAKTEYMHTHFK